LQRRSVLEWESGLKKEKDRSSIVDLKTKNTIFGELSTVLAEAEEASEQAREAARRTRNRRWFGGGLILVAIFLAVLCIFMAPGFYRSLFVGYSLLLVIVGAWQIDRAKRD
jgi:uncharacterized membrane protein YukC